MLEIENKTVFFRNKTIWFADCPFDVDGFDSVNFMSCKKKVDALGFVRYDFPTLVIDLTQELDAIWHNIRKSCRNKISRAQREGITVKINESYDEFYEINKSFREKKGLGNKLVVSRDFMQKYGSLLTSALNNEVLTGILWLEDDSNIRGLVAASKRLGASHEKANLIGFSNALLWWESIRYAKEKGIKEFDLGGYYTGKNKDDPRVGINFFKEGFGGQFTVRYHYEKVYNKANKLARLLHTRMNTLMHPDP